MDSLYVAREFAKQLESVANTTVWSEGAFHPGKTVTESLTEAADRADFAVFILTTDDPVDSRQSFAWLARPNVIFEMGFLAGRIGLSRTFFVVADPAKVELPSDLAGIMYIPLSATLGSDPSAAIAPAAAAIRKVIGEVGIRADRKAEFFSCFISYSWNDKDFAAQLFDDLKQVGVRCWLDAKEMRVGDKISEQIDRAIQAHDKVLLVISKPQFRA